MHKPGLFSLSFTTTCGRVAQRALFLAIGLHLICSDFGYLTGQANAYPIFAQQNYANPREANGRIVCANCHLAQKSVEIEVPQAVLPDTVFEAVVKIPYDQQVKQGFREWEKWRFKRWCSFNTSGWF